ncbi:regulatory protein RecX [Meiothermus rufus]|uniref:regulatory protein RecX n=1 Tax=Meiothermus rufus TaxID=604332 RepID=UPI00042A7945|nr:regulatory protein RecX [Meiothermus rufus]
MDAEALFRYALRLLSARAYTKWGLRQKLARRGPPPVVEEVVGRLRRLGYLDDRSYAQGYARLHAGRWGPARLGRALREKGVPSAIVEEVLAEQAAQHDPVGEAQALLKRYPSRHKGDRVRAVRFLLNRGYTLEQALEAWKAHCAEGDT